MKRQVEEVAAAPGKAPLTADLLVCVGSLRGQSPGRPSCHLGCSLDEEWTAGVFDESEKKRRNRKVALIVLVLAKDKGKSSFQGSGGWSFTTECLKWRTVLIIPVVTSSAVYETWVERGVIRVTGTLPTVNPEWCRKHTKGSTHRGSKGREGAKVSGLKHSLWNYCVRDTREKMCIVEHRQEEMWYLGSQVEEAISQFLLWCGWG